MSNLKAQLTKRSSTAFLQFVIVLFGLGVLALLLWEPHLEGRNAKATLFEIYFKDPFLAYVYFASIPFFIGLYQGFKALGYAGQNKLFSHEAVRALRIIKYCALAVLCFVLLSFVFMFFSNDPDDGPPGIVMRLFVAFPSIVVAAAAATFERTLQTAVDLKSENDLTV